MVKSALLVMDLQFGPLWGTFQKDETLNVIKGLIKKSESEQVPVIYTQHEEQPGGMLARGSQFWQFEPGITPREEDMIIHKQSTDAFYKTDLKEKLESLGVTHLIVVGARTEFCVDTTCRSAITREFHVTLVADGHTTVDGVISAESIIKHHNHHLNTIATTARKINVITAEHVQFQSVLS